ncbi:MAG: Ribosome-binding factor [Patescibacteria group bacterium]|nr:Ribosome-binding factor [Patescibacteria group bacterium]
MSKLEKINSILQQELANALNKQTLIEGVLVTISYVECSPDLKQAKVGVSVLPDNLAGTVLKKLKATTHILVANVKGRLKLRRLPRFIWEFDNSEREARKIEQLIKKTAL